MTQLTNPRQLLGQLRQELNLSYKWIDSLEGYNPHTSATEPMEKMMNQHGGGVSLPTGTIGAMCQISVEEYPDLFDDTIPRSQADEILGLLRELYAEKQITASAYWELAHALGR